MSENHLEELQPEEFYQKLIRPIALDASQLVTNLNQVAGHTGFYSLQSKSNVCLKPFNTRCVRGRREHLFYQLTEYFKKCDDLDTSTNPSISSGGGLGGEIVEVPQSKPTLNVSSTNTIATTKKLKFRHFPLLTYPSPATKCKCVIDEAVFKLLSRHVPNFYNVKHLSDSDDFQTNRLKQEQFSKLVYSNNLSCPCYGRDPKEKSSCARDYDKVDFLSLEDLAAHCREPCIIDIKIGQITYDPMAIKEKVLEQSGKYKRLREFGFRILGMKLGSSFQDKNFGRTLETTKQVYDALDSFFTPLENDELRCVVISKILREIEDLLEWFERKNTNQLRFFSSSLLIIYDSHINNQTTTGKSTNTAQDELTKSVRVSMIDFAHVFHVHDETLESGDETKRKDENYIFGLKKLKEFFIKMYQSHLPHHKHPHLPPG